MRFFILLFSVISLYSCNKDVKKTLDFDADMHDYILFNEGSYWIYSHTDTNNFITVEKIELVKVEESIVESLDNENLINQVTQTFYNHHTTEYHTRYTKEEITTVSKFTQYKDENNEYAPSKETIKDYRLYKVISPFHIFYSNIGKHHDFFSNEFDFITEESDYQGTGYDVRIVGNKNYIDNGVQYNGTTIAYAKGVGIIGWTNSHEGNYIISSFYIAP